MAKASVVASKQANALVELQEQLKRIEEKLDIVVKLASGSEPAKVERKVTHGTN